MKNKARQKKRPGSFHHMADNNGKNHKYHKNSNNASGSGIKMKSGLSPGKNVKVHSAVNEHDNQKERYPGRDFGHFSCVL